MYLSTGTTDLIQTSQTGDQPYNYTSHYHECSPVWRSCTSKILQFIIPHTHTHLLPVVPRVHLQSFSILIRCSEIILLLKLHQQRSSAHLHTKLVREKWHLPRVRTRKKIANILEKNCAKLILNFHEDNLFEHQEEEWMNDFGVRSCIR